MSSDWTLMDHCKIIREMVIFHILEINIDSIANKSHQCTTAQVARIISKRSSDIIEKRQESQQVHKPFPLST